MTAPALRIWFLCTLLVVGLLPMPAAGASHGCCGGGLSDPVAKAMVPDVPSCCQSEAATVAPCGETGETGDAPDEHDGGCDGCSDGGPCGCPRCGCHHPGPVPAVRTPTLHLTFVAPAAAIAVPQRQWTPGDATDSLLRPPRR